MKYLLFISLPLYLLDRITKLLVEDRLAGRPPVQVIPGVLDLNYTTNSGGAFGLGRSAPLVFAAATVLVAIAIGIASLRLSRPSAAIALGLVLGGALGNLTEADLPPGSVPTERNHRRRFRRRTPHHVQREIHCSGSYAGSRAFETNASVGSIV